MRGLFTNQLLSIAPGETISGIAPRAQTLRVTRGNVWLTVEGIKHDYWLCAGDSFTAIPGKLIVIEADSASSIDTRRAGARQAVANVGAWLVGLSQRLFGHDTVSLKRNRGCNSPC
ncbi:DUF2917 domain-containing protein [Noviherbaspirillum sp. CPCC 100848]|uniref:DUF2917 domain-containing protein n=1 Tax=Noviherbaspirillum album TaxID=3080276 RepID=A0ABU6JG61_9BURK|nr:DUF2917 domain-containing protein [Noviherbaspirillum sp. CPCC 100848]MEC4722648.1 DUF2917 domain-containing protein [Noviherbaspirillum sp. CPCC 100848]